jgi:hypothetical protein
MTAMYCAYDSVRKKEGKEDRQMDEQGQKPSAFADTGQFFLYIISGRNAVICVVICCVSWNNVESHPSHLQSLL